MKVFPNSDASTVSLCLWEFRELRIQRAAQIHSLGSIYNTGCITVIPSIHYCLIRIV